MSIHCTLNCVHCMVKWTSALCLWFYFSLTGMEQDNSFNVLLIWMTPAHPI